MDCCVEFVKCCSSLLMPEVNFKFVVAAPPHVEQDLPARKR